MTAVPLFQVLLALVTSIALIIILTTKIRVHAFFALLLACFAVGLIIQMPAISLMNAMKDGFGNIMKSLGLIIVLGTTLGVLLEHTGSTRIMADFILKKTVERNAALAMSITGFIVGLPIFCDSGYIVLSGLNRSMTRRTGIPMAVMSISLATGLYSVHCLVPPHPGVTAAAGTIGVDIGKLIWFGIIVAFPAMIVGHWWARLAGKKIPTVLIDEKIEIETTRPAPSVMNSFLPVLLPILLITLHSFFTVEKTTESNWTKIFSFLGEPVIALSIGVLLAFNTNRNWKKNLVSKLLSESAEKAGAILVIIGAGGAFGAVLAATQIGQHLGNSSLLSGLGILFPFLLTFTLKTAQGSSTVAIITASSIVLPLLTALGLNNETGKILCVLSMGAGSMMISHANDAYFWVITKFSSLEMKTMLKVYSIASILMGLITLLIIYLISLIML